MTDPSFQLTLAAAALVAIAIVCASLLHGWREWIKFKQSELQVYNHADSHEPGAASRIEMADLKERLKKLEAIAAGVEL